MALEMFSCASFVVVLCWLFFVSVFRWRFTLSVFIFIFSLVSVAEWPHFGK